jgi:hypothetical protein
MRSAAAEEGNANRRLFSDDLGVAGTQGSLVKALIQRADLISHCD